MPTRPSTRCPMCKRLHPGTGRCPACTTQTRGTRQERGYTAEHDRLRRQWARRVATGAVLCARCGQLITATEPWDLGHTDDRTKWTGPEHANRCNRSAGGRSAHVPKRT